MIAFTDNQIQEITGQILATPKDIEDLNANKAKLIAIKQDYKDLDDSNIIYGNFYTSIITQYHEELKYLNGLSYPNPTPGGITAGNYNAWYATYFPNTWFFLPPKLQATDLTSGSSTPFSPTEPDRYNTVSKWITLLETGFSDGGGSTTLNGASTSGKITVLSTSGFTIGNRIVVFASASTNYAYGTINNIIGSDIFITVEIGNLAAVGSVGSAAVSHSGFTLSERESNTGLTFGELGYANGLKAQIDTTVQDWENTLNLEITAITNNPVGGSEGTTNSAQITTISALISALDTWQALPTTGVTSRYGAALDTYIVAAISARPASIATRIATITTNIGSASQSSGNISGSGNYLKYCNLLSARIHKVEGTLSKYVATDTGITAINQKIALKQTNLTRDTETFDVKTMVADGTGSDTIKVSNVAGLSNGQTVKITSNTKGVITTTIVSINDLSVQLAASIGSDYTVADKARLVRQLQ